MGVNLAALQSATVQRKIITGLSRAVPDETPLVASNNSQDEIREIHAADRVNSDPRSINAQQFFHQLSGLKERSNFLNILNNTEGQSVQKKVAMLINLCKQHGQNLSLLNPKEKTIIEAIKENFGKDFIGIISFLPSADSTLAKLNQQDPLTKQTINSYGIFFDLTKPSLDLFVNQLSSFDQRSKFLNILNNIEGKGAQNKVAKLVNLCKQHGQNLSLLND